MHPLLFSLDIFPKMQSAAPRAAPKTAARQRGLGWKVKKRPWGLFFASGLFLSCLVLTKKTQAWDGAPQSGAAHLRRTSVLPQAKPWRRRNSLHSRRRLCRLTDVAYPLRVLRPSISNFHGYHKKRPHPSGVAFFGGDYWTRTFDGPFHQIIMCAFLRK